MNLSAMGIFHTVAGAAALVAVVVLLVQDKRIRWARPLGKFYLAATALTAASALTIFKHGEPNPAHVLGVITLLAVIGGIIASKVSFLGGAQKYIVSLCFSATVLFHLLPTATEILTRFPMEAPMASGLEDPLIRTTFTIIEVLFLVGLALQMNWLRKQPSA